MLFHPDFIYFIYLLTTKSLNINIIALFLSVYFDKTTWFRAVFSSSC